MIITVCGSKRFCGEIDRMVLVLSLEGHLVFSLGTTDTHLEESLQPEERAALVQLHRRKIDMSDQVLFMNVRGYFGEQTMKDLAYAKFRGKAVRYFDPALAELFWRSYGRGIERMVKQLKNAN